MNRILKKHKTKTDEINKISFSYFDDKIHICNDGIDMLALGY